MRSHRAGLFAHYGETAEPEIISPDVFPDLPDFAAQFAKQSSWEWNFGKAPAFSHLLNERFVWGGVDLFFDVEKGTIARAQVFTDSLNPARCSGWRKRWWAARIATARCRLLRSADGGLSATGGRIDRTAAMAERNDPLAGMGW